MPTVNTLVVDRADRLGLGQLHQLRGRVGRAGQPGLCVSAAPGRPGPERGRLRDGCGPSGSRRSSGSGFKIAMRDLEIRGAGNLLGRDQSGHIAAVGYDLYVQMVAEAVAEMKGEPIRPAVEVKIDVPSDAHLPADYVGREDLRLEAYRRLASVTGESEVDDIRAEWLDRFGPLPAPADGLLAVARLRVECLRTGVREVSATAARPGQASATGRPTPAGGAPGPVGPARQRPGPAPTGAAGGGVQGGIGPAPGAPGSRRGTGGGPDRTAPAARPPRGDGAGSPGCARRHVRSRGPRLVPDGGAPVACRLP